jgi:hypothetical protein
MASDRQIAANRCNARNSTGPRSGSGKKRASQNAHRHGLTLPISGAESEREREIFARQIAGDTQDKITLELARDAAEAALELARVRRVKVALIERVAALGSFERPEHFRSSNQEVRWLIAMYNWQQGIVRVRPPMPTATNPSSTVPSQEPPRTAEAARRVLPDLLKLQRYESRAVTRRDRAIRAMMRRCVDL